MTVRRPLTVSGGAAWASVPVPSGTRVPWQNVQFACQFTQLPLVALAWQVLQEVKAAPWQVVQSPAAGTPPARRVRYWGPCTEADAKPVACPPPWT